MGRDGFYVFLKEVEGTATLRQGSVRDEATFTVPINRVMSLEQDK